VKGLAIGIVASAIAFAILVTVLPAGMVGFGGQLQDLAILALLAGVVNALVKPVVKALSFPISVLTLGLSGIVVNAAMLLAIAYASDKVLHVKFTVGGFPAHGITADTIVGAVVAAVALAVISTIVGLVVHD
jgi:putative membrane protein